MEKDFPQMFREDSSLEPGVTEILREATRSGTPAMKARRRKLLIGLERG